MSNSSISTNESTILKKIGKDKGWEIETEEDQKKIVYFSSFFPEKAEITKSEDGTFVLSFSRKLDIKKLSSSEKINLESDGTFHFTLDKPYKTSFILGRIAQLFSSLPDNPLEKYQEKIKEFSQSGIEKTEAERFVKERIGQDIYRDALMKYWNGACAVTGCTLSDALRASHAKPWRDCVSDAERLNVYNGFLLTANLDALFDKGYISFNNDGEIMISRHLEHSDLQGLGLSTSMKLTKLEPEHLPFLKYHQENIWKK